MFGVSAGGGSSSGAAGGGGGRPELGADVAAVSDCSTTCKATCCFVRFGRFPEGCGVGSLAVCDVRASPNTGWKHLRRVSWRSTWCSNKSDRDGVCAVAAMPSSASH